MRLLRGVTRLESAASSAAAASAEATALPVVDVLWSGSESRIAARSLQRGEYIAADVFYYGGNGCARLSERVTRDESDLGVVYDGSGAVIGRVTGIEGSLITMHFADGWEPPRGEGLAP